MTELTEKELRAAVRSSVRMLVKHCHDHGSIPAVSDCILAADKEVRERLTLLNRTPGSRVPAVSTETLREMDRWMVSARGDIQAMAEDTLRSSLADIRIRDISATGITAIAEQAIREKGFQEYRFTQQTRRVKVGVRMPHGRWFSFCIRHAHAQDDLAHVEEGLECALRLSGLFDKDTTMI